MTAKEEAEALVAQADTLRGRLLEERKKALDEVIAIDEILSRLPGASQHPPPASLDEWRIRRRALQAIEIGRQGTPIGSQDIIHATAVFYGLTVAALKGSDRHAKVARARHVAMYAARKLTSESFTELGASFGGRDHTTVIAAVQKIEELLPEDVELRDELAFVDKAIREAQALRAKPPAPVEVDELLAREEK